MAGALIVVTFGVVLLGLMARSIRNPSSSR